MRYIGKHMDKKIRERQIDALLELLSKQKTKKKMGWFLKSVATESELAYIAQRLEIMNLVVAGRTYNDIKYEVGTSDPTIRMTKDQLEKCDDSFMKLLKNYYSQSRNEKGDIKSDGDDVQPLVRAHYPGAIKLK